eukprot:scaffold26372_cov120-Isochrysis_galbana.AAC.8
MIPSSHSRAVAYSGWASASNRSRISPRYCSSAAPSRGVPCLADCAALTSHRTPAAWGERGVSEYRVGGGAPAALLGERGAGIPWGGAHVLHISSPYLKG